MAQVEAYANGTMRQHPRTGRDCYIDTSILQALKTVVVDRGTSIRVSSLNRYCSGDLTASGTSSYHWRDGGGRAVDIDRVNGVLATGNTAQDRALIQSMTTALPGPAGLGQSNCRSTPVSVPSNWVQFSDSCNHNHFEFRGTSSGVPTIPVTDTDGDGVPDANDVCPGAAGFAMYDGCPIPRSANSTDFSGDGTADVFFAHPNGQWWTSNNGASPWQAINTAGVAPALLQFADFDGDGKSDVFWPNPATGDWLVSYGGNSGWNILSSGNGIPGHELQLGDFNGDGKADVFWANAGAAQWWISYGGNSPWAITATQVPATGLRIADLTGDGKDDVFWAHPSGEWWLSPNGSSSWQIINNAGISASLLKFGDVDGDGKDDVVLPNPATGNWQVSFGGTTPWAITASANVRGEQLQLADLTGDGKADMFWPNPGAGQWWISSGASGPWQAINTASIDYNLLIVR
ncbi:VCBS repeat-containing protein [uncultured Microbacterium sp.]|uniref:FG-GAP repeat domain-containing protein n=1 Tax=uncultured Microbacterium sp. TaxID=191216 RepID=UPI0028DC9ECC|nr:VCBS repeat-containing protein [uncultured Microbacterium sp.]